MDITPLQKAHYFEWLAIELAEPWDRLAALADYVALGEEQGARNGLGALAETQDVQLLTGLAAFASETLDDEELARQLANRALDSATGFGDLVEIAPYAELLDSEHAQRMVLFATELATSCADLTRIADELAEGGAHNEADTLVERACEMATGADEWLGCAEVYAALNNLERWASCLARALKVADSALDLVLISESCEEDDRSTATSALAKAELVAEDHFELLMTAEQWLALGERDRARAAFERAVLLAHRSARDLRDLASSLEASPELAPYPAAALLRQAVELHNVEDEEFVDNLVATGDVEVAAATLRRLYDRADGYFVDLAERAFELGLDTLGARMVGRALEERDEDPATVVEAIAEHAPELARRVFETALIDADTVHDLSTLAYIAASHDSLGGPAKVGEIIELALERADDAEERECIAADINSLLDDPDWAWQVRLEGASGEMLPRFALPDGPNRYRVAHPSQPRLKATFGFDRALGFFVEMRGRTYDAISTGYNARRPLEGALDFLSEAGLFGRDELEDALGRLRVQELWRMPPETRRPAEVVLAFKKAAD